MTVEYEGGSVFSIEPTTAAVTTAAAVTVVDVHVDVPVDRFPGRRAWRFGMFVARTVGLFVATALAEIIGCYLPYLWLRRGQSPWLLVPAALSLAAFGWMLTLHPFAAGRTYAAYGGIYVGVALLWLWLVEGVFPDRWDLVGGAVTLAGMAIIAFAPRG